MNKENSKRITLLNEEVEKYKTTINIVEQDRDDTVTEIQNELAKARGIAKFI